jgi:hypothetical protein
LPESCPGGLRDESHLDEEFLKSVPVPTFASLMPHRQALEAMWSDMLSHQSARSFSPKASS